MRFLVVASTVAILSGCVSPGDVETNAPTIKQVTSKDPRSYAICVLPKWQDARRDASMNETVNGYRLLVASNYMTDEVLDVEHVTNGSQVTLRQRMPWSAMPGRTAIESAVRSCL